MKSFLLSIVAVLSCVNRHLLSPWEKFTQQKAHQWQLLVKMGQWPSLYSEATVITEQHHNTVVRMSFGFHFLESALLPLKHTQTHKAQNVLPSTLQKDCGETLPSFEASCWKWRETESYLCNVESSYKLQNINYRIKMIRQQKAEDASKEDWVSGDEQCK